MTAPINFGELLDSAGGGFEPIPKADYDVSVSSAEAAQSSTGKLMFKIVYKIVGGPYNGRTIYNNITLTTDNPNALRMFFMNMKAMGLDESFFATSPAPSVVADALVGHSCRVTIDHREWQGQVRENVKSLKPSTGGAGAVPAVAGLPAAPPAAAPVATPAAPAPAAPAPAVAPPAAPPAPPAAPVIPEPVAPAAPEPEVAPPAPPAPEPEPVATAPVEQIPAGYEAIWSTMPDAAKQAILASQPAPAEPAATPAAPSGMVPPPPVVF